MVNSFFISSILLLSFFVASLIDLNFETPFVKLAITNKIGSSSIIEGIISLGQFNDFKLISDADLKLLSDTMGLKPVYPADGQSTFDDYKNVLSTTVKNTLQSAYDFSDENMAGW